MNRSAPHGSPGRTVRLQGIPPRWILGAAVALSLSALRAGEQGDLGLHLIVRDSYLPGIPLLVRVEIRNADGTLARHIWDAEASLAGAGAAIAPDRVRIRNGIRSALVDLTAEGDVVLLASALGMETSRALVDLSGAAPAEASGSLPPGLTEWEGVVRVRGGVRVPAGSTLRVLPGTLVLLDGVASGEDGADIDVEGMVEALGTEERPVTFTAANPAEPWGELDHDGAEPSTYRHVVITRAGHSPRGGHTNTGPAVRVRGGSSVVFESSTLADNAGKVLQASDADLVFRDSLLTRSVMGPEISGTALLCERTYFMDMFGEVANDGNDGDGIYIHDQRAGQVVLLTGVTVADCTDDGIDTLDPDVTIEDAIVRDMKCDKGISIFGGMASIRWSLIADNDKGISAKSSGGSAIDIDHVTFAGNRWSIESRLKSNAMSPENRFGITSSIIRHNRAADGSEGCESNEAVGGRSIRTDFDPSYFTIAYTDLEEGFQVEGTFHAAWPGAGAGNTYLDPLFMDPSAHDFSLAPASPCIDAGDPAAPLDADGSRTDMGAFPFVGDAAARFRRGDANGDGVGDISDPIRILLHLFSARPIDCEDAADANDDGEVNLTDAVVLLDFLFRADGAPPDPAGACGPDPTPDDLGCSAAACR